MKQQYDIEKVIYSYDFIDQKLLGEPRVFSRRAKF
jgi:hypothetical protein